MPAVDIDALYTQLRRRLLQNGEWDRIQATLKSKLNESGWTDDLRNRSKERARNMDPLSFQSLLEDVGPTAQTSIPPNVKREIMVLVKQHLEKQFE